MWSLLVYILYIYKKKIIFFNEGKKSYFFNVGFEAL